MPEVIPGTEADGNVDVTKLDVDSMLDVTSYGGVNLKQEEAEILGSLAALQPDDDEFESERGERVKVQNFLNPAALNNIVSEIGMSYRFS